MFGGCLLNLSLHFTMNLISLYKVDWCKGVILYDTTLCPGEHQQSIFEIRLQANYLFLTPPFNAISCHYIVHNVFSQQRVQMKRKGIKQ